MILFIGLSALTCRTRADAGRAVVAGLVTVVLLVAVPAAGALGAILVAIGAAATMQGRPA